MQLLFSVEQISEMMNVGKSTVYDWISSGKLKSVRIPTTKKSVIIRIAKSEAERFFGVKIGTDYNAQFIEEVARRMSAILQGDITAKR